MASLIEGFEYDIFISYRQKDNKYDGWVTGFVDNLKKELEATFKEEISVYFDINPHDGLLETHDVDESLREKLKCLIFIPIISRTYCDPKSFAWNHEFKAFIEGATKDQFGLKIKLPNGNVARRVLPVRIYDLSSTDNKLCESLLGGAIRGVEFIFKSTGVNRPLRSKEDNPNDNLNRTFYRDQINKVANAIKEIISGMKGEPSEFEGEPKEVIATIEKQTIQEKSIIVLPFANMSSDPEQEYFSDGLTEEVIADLSNIHDLLVISRSSAMTFKGTRKTIPEIAHAVNVSYVLEGSVRKAGNNLRITAQLINAMTDTHLWAEKYSGRLNDVFDIQEKVSQDIVHALKLKLTTDEKRKISLRPIDNFEAFNFYLRAYQEFWKFTGDAFDRALKFLQQAADITGDNELLYSSMALIYYQYVNTGLKQKDYITKALEYARKAFGLNPDSPTAHHVMGVIALHIDGNPHEAVRYFKHALVNDPSLQPPLISLIATYGYCGKISAAIPLFEKLITVNPLSLQRYYFEGFLQFYDGNFNAALRPFKHFYQKDPGNPINFFYAWALAYCNNYEEAISVIDTGANSKCEDAQFKASQMLKFSLLADKEKVLKLITPNFQKTCKREGALSYIISTLLAFLGEKEKALDWLDNAINKGFLNYKLMAEKDVFIKNIRGEGRFKKLMERAKYEWERFEV
jgi:non-specific serine/threonine protein kinase